jgi:hypothetical protein
VGLVALIALLAGMFVSYKLPSLESRKYEVGIATARILVDTPASQVVDVAPKGSDSLGVRATLIANLMVDGVVKSAISKRAGIPEKDIFGVADAAEASSPSAAKPDPRGYSLATKVLVTATGDSLPIIEVSTQAPDARRAEKLANASIEGLRDYLGTKAVADQIPDAQRLRVSGLGVPQAQQQVRGPRLVFSIAAAFFVFILGCAAILTISSLVRALRYGPAPQRLRVADSLALRDEAWEDEVADEAWSRSGAREPAKVTPIAPKQAPTVPAAPAPAKRVASWWGGGPAA